MTEGIRPFGYFGGAQLTPSPREQSCTALFCLVYGNDEMLVTTRRLIFEQAGYTVFTAESLSVAAFALINHQIDVLVLCQTLSDEERGTVLETAHALKPKTRCADLSFDGRDVVTDGVFVHRGLNGPPALLDVIRKILHQTTAQPLSQPLKAVKPLTL